MQINHQYKILMGDINIKVRLRESHTKAVRKFICNKLILKGKNKNRWWIWNGPKDDKNEIIYILFNNKIVSQYLS